MTDKANRCECSDPGCPEGHGSNPCERTAPWRLRRIDMDDGTTAFDFCNPCAEDALESGVFADDKEG